MTASRRGLIGKASGDRPESVLLPSLQGVFSLEGSAIVSLCFKSTHLVLGQARRHPEEEGAPPAAAGIKAVYKQA